MSYFIHADKFFLKNYTENAGYLEITDEGKFGTYYPENKKPSGIIKDYTGYWVAPGLVDTHIHGLLGYDTMDADWNAFEQMSKGLLKAGVTSWLPTTLTGSFDQLNDVCKLVGNNKQSKNDGAKIKGLHFEGPFFTKEHKGAQDPKYLRNPSIEEFDKWQLSANGMIKKISLAAEYENSPQFINYMINNGVVVSLGHSNATFEKAKTCVEAGASIFTHTFNGMSGLNHRNPGMVGAAMAMNLVYAELICDGHHIDPSVIRIIINEKGPEHVILVTDCMRAGMMPGGEYMLGELPVYVKDGMAKLKNGNSLAGSILNLNEAIKNVVDWNITSPENAIMMATYTAAKSVNLEKECGSILPGRDADFIILDDKMNLQETFINGQSVYKK